MARKEVDLQQSLYGPDSITWRVNREGVLLIGGGRALLLQVAHPLVAAGVAAHSSFRERPLQRLWRTLDLTLTITFASAARALRAVREIERVHARVHGVLDADVGPFARGTRYDANDPELLLWVYATLIDSSLVVYERFVAALPAPVKRAYYEEAKIGMRLFGVPQKLIPSTYQSFQQYMQQMIHGPTLAVGRAGREIAASILHPPLPLGVRQTFETLNLFTTGLLPPAVRDHYGLDWGTGREVLMNGMAAAAQRIVPWLPEIARCFPHARQAVSRPPGR
jgi:uncharacterized protein (DUF2236 family)